MKTVNVENIEKRIDWINSILKNDSFKKYSLPAQLKALRFESDCLCKLLGLMENKNEFPNPVDGDVKALIGLCKIEIKRWKAASESNPNMRYMVALMDTALASLTAEIHSFTFEEDPQPLYTKPPAQLLRPVELPDCVDDLHGVGPVMSADAVVQALRQQGYEVKND